MSSSADEFVDDEAEYGSPDERRLYRDQRGYPKNARPYSARQTAHRLADLQEIAARCARIVARGDVAFFADDEDGELLRAATERYVIAVGNVVEKLHSDYKDSFPDVPWRAITGMRNLVAHHYDKVDHEVVWQAVRHRVPALISALGLTDDPSVAPVLPAPLRDEPRPASTDPFPAPE